MIPQYVAGRSSCNGRIAALQSQGGGLGQVMYVLCGDSAKVDAGRTQAVLTSYVGMAGMFLAVIPQEYRSRGCRKAGSFLPLASLHSQRHVRPRQKKSYMLTNPLCRSNRQIRANTSDVIGRGAGAMPGPALFLSVVRP